MMLYNYLKIAWRKLPRRKVLSFITIFGLGISLAVCLLITLYIKEELSYDSFQSHYKRIALFRQFENSAGSGAGFADLLRLFPQVEKTARIIKVKAAISAGNGEMAAYESNFCFVDSTVTSILDFQLMPGGNRPAWTSPDQIFISQKMALKYFHDCSAIGQSLLYNGQTRFYIAGIFKDLPANSHLAVDFLANFTRAPALLGQKLDGYWDNQCLTYVLLTPSASLSDLTAQLPGMIKRTNDPNASIWHPALLPLRDIYLRASLDDRVKATNAIGEVYVFSIISLFIMLLAALNYINITLSSSISQMKETGIRKIIGANRKDILLQFLTESFLTIFLAAVLAWLLGRAAILPFNRLSGASLSASAFYSLPFLITYTAVITVFALLNGIYPAAILSAFRPAAIIKNNIFQPNDRHRWRRVFVTFQFSVSMVILIGVIVVWKQLFFVHSQYLGYDRQQVLTFPFPNDTRSGTQTRFLNALQQISAVKSATVCTNLPGEGAMHNKLVEDYIPKGGNAAYTYLATDRQFLNVFNLHLLQGENFSGSSVKSSPAPQPFLINRKMADYLQLGDHAVGRPLAYYSYQYGTDGSYKEVPVNGTIIGVIEDYHQNNLRSVIEPELIQLNSGEAAEVAVKLNRTDLAAAIRSITILWKKTFPGQPLDYRFLDDRFNEIYRKDSLTGRSLTIFAVLAIVISCMGLLGLTTISIETRKKEISIRKVLGASLAGITILLSKDFLKPVLLSILIATPIAWYIMNQWLMNYAYRIDTSWWMFALAGGMAVLIAVITISIQTIRAGVDNPIRNLKAE